MRNTPTPEWLQQEWKHITQAPQSGTLEARALYLLRINAPFEKDPEWGAEKRRTTPRVLKALAMDLMVAALEAAAVKPRPGPSSDPVVWLMQTTLGLPSEYSPGNWSRKTLETRGRPEQAADMQGAQDLADKFRDEHGESISQRGLRKLMEAKGRKTSTSTIAKWIAKKQLKL